MTLVKRGGDEGARLIAQARQHLQFYRELGLEGIDERQLRKPGAPAISSDLPGVVASPEGALAAGVLENLRLQEIGDCKRCKLCEGRATIVFGDGAPGARLMFIGEAPGADEDRQGLPFVGRAGQLLNKIIDAMGFRREDVYIANVVKCRPPENRPPEADEVESCLPFLRRQIEIIRPRVIVTLGSPAAQALLGTNLGISKVRGTFREYEGIRVMPTFHPAYLLRNPAAKREVWEDMQQVMAWLASQ